MPWSACTTRSPGDSPAASVRKFSARRRRRGARISRSPSTSCSAITVSPGASKPCSSAQTARWSPPSPRELARVADVARVGHAAVGEQPRQPLAGAGGVARHHHVARPPPRLDVARQRPEEAQGLLLPLRREVAPDAPAGVDHPRPERLGQRREPVQRAGPPPPAPRRRRRGRAPPAAPACRRCRASTSPRAPPGAPRTARRAPPSARRGRRRCGRRAAPAPRGDSRRASPAARGRTAASARSPGACARR